MIKRMHGERIVYTVPKDIAPLPEQLVEHAVAAYGFLLNTPERRFQEYTWGQFADMIEEAFAPAEPTRQVITATLRSLEVPGAN